MGLGIAALATVVVACLVIYKACDFFELGSSYLGRNFPPGVRGATINAIGSSLPELLTTFFLLFVFRDQDGYSAGIATCAGSAIFNAVVIPALVLLVAPLAKGEKVPLDKSVILRDGAFFVAAEIILIVFLSAHRMFWWMGVLLLGTYAVYTLFLVRQVKTFKAEHEEEEPASDMYPARAWTLLAVSSLVIGAACYALSWAVIALSEWMQIPSYFTAVVFAAAATSVPDTILSVKDAQQGDYDDAIANAVGSNIFDVTVCLGLPLLAYGLVYGPVELSAVGSAANVQTLRLALLAVTAAVLALLLVGRVGKGKAYVLLGLYGGWLLFLSGQAWG
jgi:cation:H+ antiporter